MTHHQPAVVELWSQRVLFVAWKVVSFSVEFRNEQTLLSQKEVLWLLSTPNNVFLKSALKYLWNHIRSLLSAASHWPCNFLNWLVFFDPSLWTSIMISCHHWALLMEFPSLLYICYHSFSVSSYILRPALDLFKLSGFSHLECYWMATSASGAI